METHFNSLQESSMAEKEKIEDSESKKINLILPVGIIAFILGTAILISMSHSAGGQASTKASTQDGPFNLLGSANDKRQNVQGAKDGPALGPKENNSPSIPPTSKTTTTPVPKPSSTPAPETTPAPTSSPSPTLEPTPTPTIEPTPSPSPEPSP